jgi:hypothetical protein
MGLLKLWTEIFQNQVLHKFVSRYKHAVYAIVIPLLKKDYSQASNIQGFLAMKLQGVVAKVGKEITQWQGNVLIILIINGGPGSVIWI